MQKTLILFILLHLVILSKYPIVEIVRTLHVRGLQRHMNQPPIIKIAKKMLVIHVNP